MDMRKPDIILDRETIQSGRLEDMLTQAHRDGHIKRQSPAAFEASRRRIIDALPPGRDVWVFAYGSLIWNPVIAHDARVSATLYGFRRAFCFWIRMGRGSPERPGLMLGLIRGGLCRGVAYRVPWRRAEEELKFLWRREMITSSYDAQILPVMTAGGRVPAISLVANPHEERYAGDLPVPQVVDVLSTAEGMLGTNRQYLSDTVRHLADMGIRDPYLDALHGWSGIN